jgi:hypothetical protein
MNFELKGLQPPKAAALRAVLDFKLLSRLRSAAPFKTSFGRGAGLSFTALKSALAEAPPFAI